MAAVGVGHGRIIVATVAGQLFIYTVYMPTPSSSSTSSSSGPSADNVPLADWAGRPPVVVDARCASPAFLVVAAKAFAVVGSTTTSANTANSGGDTSSSSSSSAAVGGGSGSATGVVALFSYDGRALGSVRPPSFRPENCGPAHFALSNDAVAMVDRGDGAPPPPQLSASNLQRLQQQQQQQPRLAGAAGAGRTVLCFDVRTGRQLGGPQPLVFSHPVTQIGLSQVSGEEWWGWDTESTIFSHFSAIVCAY